MNGRRFSAYLKTMAGSYALEVYYSAYSCVYKNFLTYEFHFFDLRNCRTTPGLTSLVLFCVDMYATGYLSSSLRCCNTLITRGNAVSISAHMYPSLSISCLCASSAYWVSILHHFCSALIGGLDGNLQEACVLVLPLLASGWCYFCAFDGD